MTEGGRPTSAVLARALGIAPRTARGWLQLSDFPDVGAALGEADVATIRAWRRRRTSRGRRRLTAPGCPSPRRAGGEAPTAAPRAAAPAAEAEHELVAANLDIKRIQLREREFDLALRQGRYELREERDAIEARNKAGVRKALREIGRRIAPLAEGQPAVRIRQTFEAAVDEALRFWTQPRNDEPGADDGATINDPNLE